MQTSPAQAPAMAAPGIVGMPTPAQVYEGLKAQREILEEQLQRVREIRGNHAEALRNPERTTADKAGLEARLATLDGRIAELDKAIATAENAEATAAASPGAIVPPPDRPRDNSVHWDDVFAGGAILSFALLFPFAIAYSRRIWRRSAKITVMLPPEVATRMQAMEEALESVAVEVERIGEGQRFMTQALGESRQLGVGAAEPVNVRVRQPMHAERP